MDEQNFQEFNILQYIQDNFIGLTLLLSVFFIIYFVDYINRINALMFTSPSPIPTPTPITGNQKLMSIKILGGNKKKIKK